MSKLCGCRATADISGDPYFNPEYLISSHLRMIKRCRCWTSLFTFHIHKSREWHCKLESNVAHE